MIVGEDKPSWWFGGGYFFTSIKYQVSSIKTTAGVLRMGEQIRVNPLHQFNPCLPASGRFLFKESIV